MYQISIFDFKSEFRDYSVLNRYASSEKPLDSKNVRRRREARLCLRQRRRVQQGGVVVPARAATSGDDPCEGLYGADAHVALVASGAEEEPGADGSALAFLAYMERVVHGRINAASDAKRGIQFSTAALCSANSSSLNK